MPAGLRLGTEDVATALDRTERDIQLLARDAEDNAENQWPVLRDRTNGEPMTDEDGMAYLVVAAPPNRPGRPSLKRGETPWVFRRVDPRYVVTLADRYLLPGNPQGRSQKIIDAIAAAPGIIPGAPVRALGGARPGKPTRVIAADEPGPVLGMLLRPEGRPVGWETQMDSLVQVLVWGKMLLPAKGPIGRGPGLDRLLWDPEARCWRGKQVEGRGLLELRGSWGLDHDSDGDELPVVLLNGDLGLELRLPEQPKAEVTLESQLRSLQAQQQGQAQP